MLKRILQQQMREIFERGKVLIIMGPRQAGKSTLLKQEFGENVRVLWQSGDIAATRDFFSDITPQKVQSLMGDKEILIIDEAQRIPNIGLSLKIIADELPRVKLVATGSSSFDLGEGIKESLAGRKRELTLMPMAFTEMADNTTPFEEMQQLTRRMVTGYYPEVVTHPADERAILQELADSYLYKDILSFDSIKKSTALVKLTQALAYQIGSQVSDNELAKITGLDSKTVDKYITILEKSYIIFQLPTYSRNHRNELKASRKLYFWDLGIRNAIIGNLAPLEMRYPEEKGALWENYIIAERMKANLINGFYGHAYFWRSKDKQEVDYVEEIDGKLRAWEFKWNPAKAKINAPSGFQLNYPDASFKVITPQNYDEFLLKRFDEE